MMLQSSELKLVWYIEELVQRNQQKLVCFGSWETLRPKRASRFLFEDQTCSGLFVGLKMGHRM